MHSAANPEQQVPAPSFGRRTTTSDADQHPQTTPVHEPADGDGASTIARDYRKLDLAYFTNPARCPLMVRRGARKAFELFLFLADRFLKSGGQPVSPEHESLCEACGLKADNPNSRVAISRLLGALRKTFGVIDYEPVQRRRPKIRLAPAVSGTDVLSPKQYVYFHTTWGPQSREVFNELGSRALAAEYMYWISAYEATFAAMCHSRPYWFFPLDQLTARYHISKRFAGDGLRVLVQLGVLRVTYGQYGRRAPNNEFGAANRYYFGGLEAVSHRRFLLASIGHEYTAHIGTSHSLAGELTNGGTAKNIRGLCELIAIYGENRVRAAVARMAALPRRSLKRRLEYLRATLSQPKTD